MTGPAEPADGGAAPAPAAPTSPPEAAAPKGDKPAEQPQPTADATEEENPEGAAAGAAEEPGRASNRQQYVRAAQDVFAGDSVRDKFVFYLTGGATAPLRRLSPTLERLTRIAFVEPEDWAEKRRQFRDLRTAILRGRTGHGRATMATRLLQAVDAKVIYQLDPRVDLSRVAEQLSAQEIADGTAFLLHEPADAGGLTSYTVQSLESVLVKAKARLVVTVNLETRPTDADLLKHLIDLPEAPGLDQIFRKHLDVHLDERRADEILAGAGVAELVTETLDGASCDKAAFLALILSGTTGQIDVTKIDLDKVRELLRRLGSDTFDIWFEGLPDLETRCFAIALAVLDGLPFEDVADAAQRLRRRLSDGETLQLGENITLTRGNTDPFATQSHRLARILQAKLSAGDDGVDAVSDPAPGSPMTMAYRDDQYPRRVLERTWRGHLVHDELLDWLADLVTYGSEQVSVFASSAVGRLATLSFDKVNRRLLNPWARSKPWRKREAVADALRTASSVPGLRPKVLTTVKRWYGTRTAPLAQSTAAIAYGTGLGLDDKSVPFEALWRLTVVDDVEVHTMVGRGLASLLADDPERLPPLMYSTIRRCVADPKRMIGGYRAFLIVANDLIATDSAGSTPVRWPSLLHLAMHHDNLRKPLFGFWTRVILDGAVMGLAQLVARNWANLAETDEGVLDAFARLVRAVDETDARAGAAFGLLARRWNSDDELLPLPAVAQAIERVLPGPSLRGVHS